MNILVTGGAGYIGSHVVRLLLEAGHRVRVYDNLSEGHRAAVPPETLVVGDLQDEPALARALDSPSPRPPPPAPLSLSARASGGSPSAGAGVEAAADGAVVCDELGVGHRLLPMA